LQEVEVVVGGIGVGEVELEEDGVGAFLRVDGDGGVDDLDALRGGRAEERQVPAGASVFRRHEYAQGQAQTYLDETQISTLSTSTSTSTSSTPYP
jgi:hypothetical protein